MSIFRRAATCQAVPEVWKPADVEAEPEESYIDTWPIQSMESNTSSSTSSLE